MRGFPQKTALLRMCIIKKRDHNYRNGIHQSFFYYGHDMTTADLESLSGRMLRTAYRWVEGAKGRETRQEAGQQDSINSAGVIPTTITIIIIFITSMAKHQPIRTESIH